MSSVISVILFLTGALICAKNSSSGCLRPSSSDGNVFGYDIWQFSRHFWLPTSSSWQFSANLDSIHNGDVVTELLCSRPWHANIFSIVCANSSSFNEPLNIKLLCSRPWHANIFSIVCANSSSFNVLLNIKLRR